MKYKVGIKKTGKGYIWEILDIGGSSRSKSPLFDSEDKAKLDSKIVIGSVARETLGLWWKSLLMFLCGISLGVIIGGMI